MVYVKMVNTIETHIAWSHDKPRPLLSVFISMSMLQSLKWLFL